MCTLIYKRTHTGDPDPEGRFGIHGCMGRVRTWGFEAVIGVGGIGAEPRSYGLDQKVNWIGIGPRKRAGADERGPVVTFEHFLLFGREGRDGPSFRDLAPRLADRIYSTNVRVLMDRLDEGERSEVERVLDLAKGAPPSAADGPASATVPENARPENGPGSRSRVVRADQFWALPIEPAKESRSGEKAWQNSAPLEVSVAAREPAPGVEDGPGHPIGSVTKLPDRNTPSQPAAAAWLSADDHIARFMLHAPRVGILGPTSLDDRLELHHLVHPVEADNRIDEPVLAGSHGPKAAVEDDEIVPA